MEKSNTNALIRLFFDLGIPLGMLIGTYITGRIIDRSRVKFLNQKEEELNYIRYTTQKMLPGTDNVASAQLVSGTVVVANNYFKQFLSSFRNIFGGEMKSYSILLEHARRMAMVRMLEEARDIDSDAVVNVRLETSSIQGNNQKKGAAGVEVIAYGTALIRR